MYPASATCFFAKNRFLAGGDLLYDLPDLLYNRSSIQVAIVRGDVCVRRWRGWSCYDVCKLLQSVSRRGDHALAFQKRTIERKSMSRSKPKSHTLYFSREREPRVRDHVLKMADRPPESSCISPGQYPWSSFSFSISLFPTKSLTDGERTNERTWSLNSNINLWAVALKKETSLANIRI